ncbi:response regulator [Heliomarina baculiformis]|uniref:response regulator n=1 Tax=Heliomarina baculiformis TaxID=2872036 RepID=UPI001EE3087C|nr:response regulator [Heliomarina baculiformis]
MPDKTLTATQCLIIEDSRFDQMMMTRVMQKIEQNIDIRVVSTLDAARRALLSGRVSLILLDNNLPDGKGANFALELAEHVTFSSIPVILVSDWPSPFMFQKAKMAGVSNVVTKADFTPEVILSAMPEGATMH